jgi:hypothetical protein
MKLPINYNLSHWTVRRKAREEYARIQKGLCYYCNQPLDAKPSKKVAEKRVTKSLYPENFFDHPVHLHHDHCTGITIGAVHCHCNAVLWEYEGE